MKWDKTLQLVDVHCEGETGKVITSGVIDVPGQTMADKMEYLNTVDDSLLRFVLFEPRGYAQMAANLLLPPTVPEADVGFLVLLVDGAHAMSGSNCMCVVTAILETGILPMVEPVTEIVLDTPAGLVRAKAFCSRGRCESVKLEMPPAFVETLGLELVTEEFGSVQADVAFGGEYYLLVDAEQFGTTIEPVNARELVRIGAALKEECAKLTAGRRPSISEINSIETVMFRDTDGDGRLRTCTVGCTGRVDRSPCGTGNTANIAVLYEKGLLSIGDHLTVRSIIGSEFHFSLMKETTVGARRAVTVTVRGRSWIFGMHQLGRDPADPFAHGFMLSDTWGPNINRVIKE